MIDRLSYHVAALDIWQDGHQLFCCIETGNKNDLDPCVHGLEPLVQLKSVQLGHPDVHDNKVVVRGVHFCKALQRVMRVRKRVDVKAFGGQKLLECQQDIRLVVYDHDVGRRRLGHRCSAAGSSACGSRYFRMQHWTFLVLPSSPHRIHWVGVLEADRIVAHLAKIIMVVQRVGFDDLVQVASYHHPVTACLGVYLGAYVHCRAKQVCSL